MQTLKSILTNKNYDIIAHNIITIYKGEITEIHEGYCSYKDGVLTQLNNNSCSLDDEYVKYEEFILPNDFPLYGKIYPAGTKCLAVWRDDTNE